MIGLAAKSTLNITVKRAVSSTAAVLILLIAPVLQAADTTRVYVYGLWESPFRSWVPIYCDGAQIAKLKQGKFLAIDVAPGRHALAQGNGIPVFIDAHAGQDAFLAMEREIQIGPSGRSAMPVLGIVSPPEARKQLTNLVYVDQSKVYSALVVKEEPIVQQEPQLQKRSGRN